jgi:hypothetical protein
MRTRPNQLMVTRSAPRHPNTIYRKYRKIFQYLLNQRSLGIQEDAHAKYYVPMDDVHRSLYEAVSTHGDSIRCFLGYTGIGKSTMLRYFFNMDADNPDIRRLPIPDDDDVQQSPQEMDERVLYIPLFMDGRLIDESEDPADKATFDHFAAQLSAACKVVEEREGLEYDEAALASFIVLQKRDLLEFDGSLPINTDILTRLKGLREKYRFGFEMMRLKWLLMKSKIQRVILIVDDVESLSIHHQVGICHAIAKSFEWLISLSGHSRPWKANAIISIRPLTYHMLQKRDWYHALYFDEPIGVGKPADLKSIFEKRFDDACEGRRIRENTELSENWTAARNVFEHVYSKVARDHNNFLVNICNYNIRKALIQFESILLNSRYFEPEGGSPEHLRIQMNKLNFTEAAALKALGMGDGTVFPNLDTPLSNLFLNQLDPSADLLGALLILAIKQIGNRMSYGCTFYEKDQLLTLVASVCCLSQAQSDSLPWVVAEMKSRGLIELITVTKLDGGLKSGDFIEVMPKAKAIFAALKNTSVITEMFRDDTFVTYSEKELSDLKTTQDLPDDVSRIEAAIRFGNELVLTEKNFVERCAKAHGVSRWSATFGPTAICRIILEGINHSIRAISSGAKLEVSGHEEFTRRVSDVERTLGNRR